jgi:thymidine kinase
MEFRYFSGKLDIIMGCMFSGKTSELLKRIDKTTLIYGDNVLIITHKSYKRYGEESGIYSHNNYFKSSTSCNQLHEVIESDAFKNAKAVFIDEAQFFDDLNTFVCHSVEKLDKWVTICGLDGDFLRNRFGQLIDLIPLADSVIKLKALCLRCGNGTDALFSKRIIKEQTNKNDSVILVGHKSDYESVCRYHYNN